MGEGIGRTRHELSRSFSQNSRVSSISSMGSRKRGCQRSEGANPERSHRVSSVLQEVLRRSGRNPIHRSCEIRIRPWLIVPGLGLFGFGKNKKEARITTEFFINAIHVMAGANALEDGEARSSPAASSPRCAIAAVHAVPQLCCPSRDRKRSVSNTGRSKKPNSNACPRKQNSAARSLSSLEEQVESVARSRCCSHERALTLSSQILTSQVQRESPRKPAAISSAEFVAHTRVDLGSAASLAEAANFTISQFGGIDIVVNTAAIYPVPGR